MSKYFVSVPRIVRFFFKKSLVCRFPSSDKVIYLTFDDGPIPELTPEILGILKKYEVKACFFCVGENIRKYPRLVELLLAEGHEIGNHTYHHLKGWKTKNKAYYLDVQKFESLYSTPLFRPPYGKMKWRQLRTLAKHYKIILWSVLTYDFDATLPAKDCLSLAVKNSGPGSIVVFHDNIKAKEKVLKVLPLYIEQMLQQGYRFELIGNSLLKK